MTAKRFTIDVEDWEYFHIKDNVTGEILGTPRDFVELLNNLHEENQLLKREKECYKLRWQNQLKATNKYFEKGGV